MKPDVTVIGSKAFNLAFLNSLGYVSVPSWASVSSSIFREVVRRSFDLQKDLQVLYAETEKYSNAVDKNSLTLSIFRFAAALRQKIINLDLSEDLILALFAIYNQVSNNGKASVAVRSSALAEDLPGASFAGLYDSYLNIRNYEAFVKALKQCWASTFNDRAVQYYMQKDISLRDVYMSTVIMELVFAETSGTAFTTDITTGYNGIHVMASNGLEAVVGGDIAADSFLFHPKNLILLKRIRGSKAFRYRAKKNDSGVEKIAIKSGNDQYCISIEKAKEIAALVGRVACDYQSISKGPVDTEFVITKEGNIKLVQVRPVVMTETKQVDDVDFDALKDRKPKPIATGKHSVFGVKHGKIKIIEDFHDLESGKIQIEADDIVVTARTENQWTQYLSQFSGIITIEGNPTSHPVLISRERKVPCLVGVADAVKKFKEFDGQWVTLDGFRNCVYLDKLPLKSISMDKVNAAFNVVQEEQLQEESSMIRDLFTKGFMIEAQGKNWITGINSHFSGALLDMVANAYKLREKVINDSGIDPQVSFQTQQMVIKNNEGQGKVYDHWWTVHEEQLKICQKMTLKNCEAFYRMKEQRKNELLEACAKFDLSLSSWYLVREIYEELTAYQLLGFLERYPLIHSTHELAKSLEVPRFFFEEYMSSVPEFEEEEDVAFLNATKEHAQTLLQLTETGKKEVREIDLSFVRENWPEYYDALVAFSRQYKFLKTEDWCDAPPVEKAFEKIQEQVKQGDYQLVKKKSLEEADEEFFVDCPELRERLRLCIIKKLQQNNMHHVRLRAQWLLRDKLLILGKELVRIGKLRQPEEVLSISLKQLEQHISEYGKTAK